jgi:hypothetical protein
VAYHPFIDILKANFDIHENHVDLDIKEKVERGLNILGVDETSTQRSLGWALCRAGKHKKGIELFVNVLPTFGVGQYLSGETDLLCFLGEGYFLAGDEHKARQTFEKGLKIASR